MNQLLTATPRWKLLGLASVFVFLLMAACGNQATTDPVSSVAGSDLSRETNPSVDDETLNTLVLGNSVFAFELLRNLPSDGDNLFFSPYSVSAALAMAYAGANGNTAIQMANTLRYISDPEHLHPAFNQLDLELNARNEIDSAKGDGFQLNLVNALWGQQGYAFLDSFLDTLATNYGAGVRLLDFIEQPETSRQTINDWVSEQTQERIQDLLPPQSIDGSTRLILTNAIYFNAPWFYPFNEQNTHLEPFANHDGELVDVPMMHQTESYSFGGWDGGHIIELPYNGQEMVMSILVPDEGQFQSFIESLTAEQFSAILDSTTYERISLGFPKFEFTYKASLVNPLIELGMTDAFNGQLADFSNIDGTRDLVISDVLHKAFVAVDEAGTEAAAATAVVFRATGMSTPPKEFTINRPFVFVIRDIPTGTILFIGQVTALPEDDS